MNKFKKLTVVLTMVMTMFTTLLHAQNGATVSGRVVDSAGEPIIGAAVIEQGTSNGVSTDIDGAFSFRVADVNSVVNISYLGYKSVDLVASSAALKLVTLESDSQMLDDVVVIGYGTVKKEDLSGSVVAIKAEELNRGAVTSPQELMQGKVAGLAIT